MPTSFAIEVALQPVSYRFMQHHAGPARSEHDIHLTGWSRKGLKIDQGLPYCFVNRPLPRLRLDQSLEAFAPAKAVASGFCRSPSPATTDTFMRTMGRMSRYVSPSARKISTTCQLAPTLAVTCLTRASFSRIGIDRSKQFDLRFESRRAQGIFVAIKLAIGARRRLGIGPAVSPLRLVPLRRRVRARLREVRGMGITHSFIFYCSQPESLNRIVGRLLEPAVVKCQGFSLAILKEQFPVVGSIEPAPNKLTYFATIESGTVDKGKRRMSCLAPPRVIPT